MRPVWRKEGLGSDGSGVLTGKAHQSHEPTGRRRSSKETSKDLSDVSTNIRTAGTAAAPVNNQERSLEQGHPGSSV